jgi:hypothetical protein
MDTEPTRNRTDRALDRAVALGHRFVAWGRDLVRDPARLLVSGICIVLVAVALPLLVGGGMRLHTAWTDWRHDRTVGRDWVRTTAGLVAVRDQGGLELQLTYRDRADHRHRAEVQVESTGDAWLRTRLPIRYDPHHPASVDLIDVSEARPLGTALVAGAALGAGLAALILAFATWRRRKVLASSRHPFRVLRVPLALSGFALALGLAAWAVGTVSLRGWTGVADRMGHYFSVVFGDMLGVTVPVFAFGLGCLVTAWLARHRHHEDHEGLLSSAHRIIDRAAGYVPSPEELQVGVGADAPAAAPVPDTDADADEVRTGR